MNRIFPFSASVLALFAVSWLSGCARDSSSNRVLSPLPPLMSWQAPPRPLPPMRAPAPDVPPSYLVLLPNEDGTTGQVFMNSSQGRQTLNRAKEGADVQGGSNSFPVTDQQIKRDFGAAMAARPTLPERFRLHFNSGTSQLTQESQKVLDAIIRRSQNFSALEVLVIGHTDTRGDPDDNFALGLRRARTAAEMMAKRGIRAVNIEIGSDGESAPLVPTPDNTPEPHNRRVEVTLR